MWFFVATSLVSYGSYLVAGSIVHARAAGTYDPVVIRDVLGPGIHRLSGMIMVPTPCDQLSVRTHAVSSSTYMLVFKTWREPSVNCDTIEMPRPFHETVFAPATGVEFVATLDGASIPILVLPVTPQDLLQ